MYAELFPVFLKDHDTLTILRFPDYVSLIGYVEPIDIDNAEYVAWSGTGKPLQLSRSASTHEQRQNWLKIEGEPQLNQRSIAEAMNELGGPLGYEYNQDMNLDQNYKSLSEALRKYEATLPWWKRLLNRF